MFEWLRRRRARASTLTRRVLAAVLMAFALVSVVLFAQSYIEFRRDFLQGADSALVKAVRVVVDSLAPVQASHDAQVVLQTIERQSIMARQQAGLEGKLLMELRDASGALVFASPDLRGVALADASRAQMTQALAGRVYRVAQAQAGPWTLRFAEPRNSDASALKLFLFDLGPSLLIALPLILLPVWLAVHHGLKPLRTLAAHLDARQPDDLSPVALDLRHVELQAVGHALNLLLEKLRGKVARERAFVQDAAHELRTPMAVISAQAHVLARAASEAQRLQAEGALQEAIQRASHLARQLLTLASLDEHQSTQSERMDLADHVQSLLAQAMPLAESRHMALALEAPDSLWVETNRGAVTSIVLNLVDNAIRYGQEGGRMVVSLSALAHGWRLCVADTGPGLPEAKRERLFERFVRGGHQEASGSGLGLAIVGQAATRLGARVSVHPGLDGRGVAFWIEA